MLSQQPVCCAPLWFHRPSAKNQQQHFISLLLLIYKCKGAGGRKQAEYKKKLLWWFNFNFHALKKSYYCQRNTMRDSAKWKMKGKFLVIRRQIENKERKFLCVYEAPNERDNNNGYIFLLCIALWSIKIQNLFFSRFEWLNKKYFHEWRVKSASKRSKNWIFLSFLIMAFNIFMWMYVSLKIFI